MVSLSRGSLPTAILSAILLLPYRPAVHAAEGDVAVDEPYGSHPLDRAIVMGDPDDEGDPTQNVESYADVSSTLLVTYSSDVGLSNILSHVERARERGKDVSLKNNNRFKKPHLPQGPDQGEGQGQGQDQRRAQGRGGGSGQGSGRGSGRGRGKVPAKRRNRWLVVDDDDELDIGFVTLEVFDGETATSSLEAELIELPGVTNVEHDIELTVMDVPSLRGADAGSEHVRQIVEALGIEEDGLEAEYAPEYPDQDHRRLGEETPYGINQVNVTHLWSITPKQQVKICVIDTGYDLGHPDLPSGGVTGWDAMTAGRWDVDGHSHGTHCAGTIGAIGNNDRGVTSVNPDPTRFTFHIAKGLSDAGSGSGAGVIGAVNDCVAQGAKVISMSLGCRNCYKATYDEAYQEAYDAGALVIAAAGNSGSDTAHYPSGYKSVMSVASVMQNRKLSSFSTRNQQTEIAAPGHYVKSTVPRNKGSYKSMSGTSMATPHVAGVAALLMSHFPDCTNNQIRNAMLNSASEPPVDPGRNTPGWDKYYGHGLVNAGNAYELLERKGCVGAGGAYPDDSAGEKLSDMALGGKLQRTNGCMSDDHCRTGNPCTGNMKCNLVTNTCYMSDPDSIPDCDDGNKCTIDTCDASRPLLNNDPTSLCVHTPKPCEDGNKCNGIKSCDADTGDCIETSPPVICDDNNACTIDTCQTYTGQCIFEPKTCDDGNSCTFGDTCDPSVGCIFGPPQTNCCGDAECDPEESEETCPEDCSDSLTTSFSTAVARRRYLGSKFNVVAKSKEVALTGTGVHCILPEGVIGIFYIYTIAKDWYAGQTWFDKAQWTRVMVHETTCAGEGKSTYIPFPEPIHVMPWQKQGFSIYVLTHNIHRDYPTTRNILDRRGRYAVYSENSYLQIQTGSGNICRMGWCAIITPMAYSGSFSYTVIDDDPTQSPTSSSEPTSQVPSTSPSLTPPTRSPTKSPTDSPTTPPTTSPTEVPSVSIAPTPFVPEVVELTKPRAGSATIVQQAYFEVTAGSEWVRIVDLKVVTYRTRGLQVYMKRGKAEGSEDVPCHWQLVAETRPGWWGSYWRTVYPPWKNFESVVVEPGETVSLYVRNIPGTGGILGKRTSGPRNWYKQSWATTSATSAVGAVTMSDGKCGDRLRRLFFPCHRGYGGYAIYGGLKLETMQDGSTQAPTAAPTLPFSPDSLTNPVESAGDLRDFNGIQFSVDNIGDHDVMITSFNVHLKSMGLTYLEVWKRDGTHKGGSIGSCSRGGQAQRYNNWCRKWAIIAYRNVQAQGPGMFTATPEFSFVIKAGSTASFAIVSRDGSLNTHSCAASAPAIQGDHLRINHATPIQDYYGNMVQTSHDLDPTPYKFEGTINYDVTNSACAALSKERWTRLPNGAGSTELDMGDPEENIIVYEPEEGDPEPEPPTDDEPWGDEPWDGDGDPIEEEILF